MNTTETKHTQGPWRVNGPYVTAQADMGLVVAIVPSKADPRPLPDAAAKDHPERAANARLLSSAPDLLAALKAMVSANDGVAVMPTYEAKARNAAITQARAAISKATNSP